MRDGLENRRTWEVTEVPDLKNGATEQTEETEKTNFVSLLFGTSGTGAGDQAPDS